MIHLDLFSGIGGFALAVDQVWPGAEHIFCEIDPFCQAVLRKNFGKEITIYGDIRELTAASTFAKIDSCKSDQKNTVMQSNSTTGDYPSATLPPITQLHDKLCGKSLNVGIVNSDQTSKKEKIITSIEEQKQATTREKQSAQTSKINPSYQTD